MAKYPVDRGVMEAHKERVLAGVRAYRLPETIEAWVEDGGSVHFDGREHGRRFAYIDAPWSGARFEAVDSAQLPDFLKKWVAGADTSD